MNRLCILVLAIGCTCFSAEAQKARKDTLSQRNVTLQKDEPNIKKSEKILLLPDLETQTLEKRPSFFSLSPNPASLPGIYLPLQAPDILTAYPAQDKIGYFRFGGGSKMAFTGDAQLNLIRLPKQTLDIRLMHRSIFGDITNSLNQSYRSYMNRNRLMANYTFHLPGNELKVGLSQQYNAWNYYGTYKTTQSPANANELTTPSGQWLSDTQFSFSIKSRKPGEALSYRLGADGHLFRLGRGINSPTFTSGTTGGSEKELTLNGLVNYRLSDNLTLGAEGSLMKFSYGTPKTFAAEQTFYTDPVSTANYFADQGWLQLHPHVRLNVKQWELTAGFRLAVPTLETERVKWNPTVTGITSLSDKAAFRVSLDGGIQYYSYREGFDLNPYLDPFIHLRTANSPIRLSAGIDYRPLKALRISPVFEYDHTSNSPFFYNALPGTDVINDAYGRIFSVKYMTSNRFTLGTDAYYNFRTKLRFFTQVRYNQYFNYSDDKAIDNLLAPNRKAWYRPGFQTRFRLDYSPVDKVSTYADYQISALRYAPTSTDFMHKLNDIHDFNLGASWEMAKDVQLFIQLNNLFDQRYDNWNAYKVHGFSTVIGGYVRF